MMLSDSAEGAAARPLILWKCAAMETGAGDHASLTELAAAHGLDIVPETIAVNDLGLDFRVAIAATADGQRWVLRIPQRPTSHPGPSWRGVCCNASRRTWTWPSRTGASTHPT